jgi:hypothetical protein
MAKEKKIKRQHNIYLSDEGDNETKIVIKGNNLDLRWFNNAIIVWSGEKDIAVKVLEIVEKTLKEEIK